MAMRLPNALVDTIVVAGMAGTLAIAIAVGIEDDARPPDARAYVLGGIIALLTLGRRRWPIGTLLASSLVLLGYYWLGYPAMPPGLALAVPLYTAAVHRKARWSLGVVAGFLAIGLFSRSFIERESFFPMLLTTLEGTSLMAAVVLAGTTVRAHRLHVAERDQNAARRVTEERLRIARELHDVLAHTISTVTVQAGVAADVLDDSPAEARTALKEIRTATRSAMEELRATLGLLREPDGVKSSLTPAPTLDQLEDLLSTARRSGLGVSLDRRGDVRPLTATIELTAYRIVQESLTNVTRHANATEATVAIDYQRDRLVVEVTDNGSGRAVNPGGHGIDGMRERAAAIGGTVSAGPRSAERGFGVRAILPIERWA